MLGIILIIFLLFLVWHFYFSKTNKENYDGMPDPCVHMMETGFSAPVIQACQNYAKKCGDTCSPYPVTSNEVKLIYDKLGVGEGKVPSAKDNKIALADFIHDGCPIGLGPGNPCTIGEEECIYPYKCGVASGKCECPSNVYAT